MAILVRMTRVSSPAFTAWASCAVSNAIKPSHSSMPNSNTAAVSLRVANVPELEFEEAVESNDAG